LILLTGDYIQFHPEPIDEFTKKWLSQLPSLVTHGVFAVLGNHDHKFSKSSQMITTSLENIGIRVLTNESIHPLGPGLQVVGLGDLWAQECHPEKVFPKLKSTVPTIVLAHNPGDPIIVFQSY
jgi:predicted MPP superfamily phosphohydrolase